MGVSPDSFVRPSSLNCTFTRKIYKIGQKSRKVVFEGKFSAEPFSTKGEMCSPSVNTKHHFQKENNQQFPAPEKVFLPKKFLSSLYSCQIYHVLLILSIP